MSSHCNRFTFNRDIESCLSNDEIESFSVSTLTQGSFTLAKLEELRHPLVYVTELLLTHLYRTSRRT